MIFEVGRWDVSKGNSEKHLEAIRLSIDFQKKNRERFLYTSSRFLRMESSNPDIETWMFIDEYPDIETYKKWLEEAELIEIEMVDILENWGANIIIDSFKTEVFFSFDSIEAK